ncbi:complement C5 [Silurus meridionalis]|uniref:complement C5 n=1 Tax=Silurus meridionalis TaxID=175797 RepID=UPI001EECE4A0|nr:complement C5 [Silurus meridionalis]
MKGLLFVLCVIYVLSETEAQDKTYLITAPKVLRVDASENVVVQLFGYNEETKVTLKLKENLATDETYANQIVTLNANNNYQEKATLRVFPNIDQKITSLYLQALSPTFSNAIKIPIIHKNGFLFIQTDKPLYTPEQEVEVRVYSLNEELRMTGRPVFLTFRDPNGFKVEVIEINDIIGVKPIVPPFKVPAKPDLGVWKIEANYVTNFTTTAVTEFEVKEYVLPSISVRIQPEKNYVSIANVEAFKLKIFANYVSGKLVKSADVYIHFGYISKKEVVMISKSLRHYQLNNGQVEIVLNIKHALSELGSGSMDIQNMNDHYLRVVVLLKESTGGISQEAVLSNIQFVHSPFTLSLIATPPFIKPYLPYNIRVLVRDPLGKPAKGIPVIARAIIKKANREQEQLKFSGTGNQNEIMQSSNNDGVAYFICNIPYYAEQADFTFQTNDPTYPQENQAQLKLNTVTYKSVNQRYLYINLPAHTTIFNVGEYAYININFHYQAYLPMKIFSYQIISKGKVVKYATERRVADTVQAINFKVTSDMVPSARLVVYYILTGEQRAELVSDSVWFDVKAKCVNDLDVKLEVDSNSYKPNDKLMLSIKTQSMNERSLVALSAVDTALYNIRSNEGDPLNKVLNHLEKTDLGCGGGGGRNNADVFSRAGLTFITNANVEPFSTDEACSAVVRAKRSTLSDDEIDNYANKYKKFKPCCLKGISSILGLDTCRSAATVSSPNKHCKKAFYECCIYFEKQWDKKGPFLLHSPGIGFDLTDRKKRSALSNHEKFEEFANRFGPLKKCCQAGFDSNPIMETCEDRTKKIRKNKKPCKDAFLKCCKYAEQQLDQTVGVTLARSEIEFLMGEKIDQVRSYFPESWLWEEHEIEKSGLAQVSKTLPDSLTTWEVKAVGMFSKGICVADSLQVPVQQSVYIDVPLPYSIMRGEQIELRGSVYNDYNSDTTYTVTMSAPEGVCIFQGTLLKDERHKQLNKGTVESRSVVLVQFFIMALEAGNHELRFTLRTKWGSDTLVKTLKVVPEGIRKDEMIGKRLDPNGIYGNPVTVIELKNGLPLKTVPKSPVERELTVNGDLLGEMLSIIVNPKGLMQLINLPGGSGEAELVSILPVFYVYKYIDGTDQWGKLGEYGNKLVLKRRLNNGLTSIMSFKTKYANSFTMFKNKEASTWLTAMVVKTLASVYSLADVDLDVLSGSIRWLIKDCQNSDGSFKELSSYKPVKLMGAGADATEQSVYLTSFVIIGINSALSVPKSNLQEFLDAVQLAVEYLLSNVAKVKSQYVRSIAAYAMGQVNRSQQPVVALYEKLKAESQVKGSPAIYRFWDENKASQDPLKPNKVSALSVETTVYMLLNCLDRKELLYCKPIIQWLTEDQRYGGGFHSTQDTILTLEALTKYSILSHRAALQMEIDVSYRKKGRISRVSLTQTKPVGKRMAIEHADDLILKTGFGTGVSFASLRTVFYETTENNDNCHFDITIKIEPREPSSKDPMRLSPRLVACAKYKPIENEYSLEAGHTVMEINLPTGVSPVEEDLKKFRDGFESRISDYEIKGSQVILQMDFIPSDEYYCLGFRIQDVFRTGMTTGSVFKVYEFHDPDSQCIKFYNMETKRLLRLCEGDKCQCMAAECCTFKANIDPTLSSSKLHREVCKANINYGLKVKIISSEEEGDFLTYKASLETVIETGAYGFSKERTPEVYFVMKATCTSTNLEIGKQYLITGKEIMQLRENRSYKYKFPLDSQATVQLWPTDSECQSSSCKQYTNALEAFELDYISDGCIGIV